MPDTLPNSFPEEVIPRIIMSNFRNGYRSNALKILLTAYLSPNPDLEQGCVVGDIKEFIYGPHHRVTYLLGRLEELMLLEKSGNAEMLTGHPNIYVLTDYAHEVFGDFSSILNHESLSGVEVAETSTLEPHLANYVTTFYSPYSSSHMSVNNLLQVFTTNDQPVFRLRHIAGMLGLMALGQEFDTEIVDPVVFREWLSDQAAYFETIAKLIHQLNSSAYMKASAPGDEAREEIFTPVEENGNVSIVHRETGIKAEYYMSAVKQFVNQPTVQAMLGETKIMFASALYDNVMKKLDTED